MIVDAGPASYQPVIWSTYNSLLIQCTTVFIPSDKASSLPPAKQMLNPLSYMRYWWRFRQREKPAPHSSTLAPLSRWQHSLKSQPSSATRTDDHAASKLPPLALMTNAVCSSTATACNAADRPTSPPLAMPASSPDSPLPCHHHSAPFWPGGHFCARNATRTHMTSPTDTPSSAISRTMGYLSYYCTTTCEMPYDLCLYTYIPYMGV
jgi:hypothetical protein